MAEPEPYSRYALYDTLGEIQGLFAELRYIDTAMDYLEGEETGWLQEFLLGETLTGNETFEVDFGQTYPFTKRYTVRGDWYDAPFGIDETRTDRLRSRLHELADEANEWAGTETTNVKELIEPFTWPQGSRYESYCVQPVTEMHEFLEDEVSNDFGLLQHTLGDWKGDAADNFASYFYFPFEQTLRSQKRLLTALLGGIASAKAIAESTQHSIMNVVCATKAALREQLELAQATTERERQQSVQRTLVIAGGVATVFAGLVTAGTATGVAAFWIASFDVVAGTTQIAALAIPEGGSTPVEVTGATAAELRDSLVDAIDQIKINDVQQHDALLIEVEAVLGRVNTLLSGPDELDGRLIPIRPDIVNGVDADTFYLP